MPVYLHKKRGRSMKAAKVIGIVLILAAILAVWNTGGDPEAIAPAAIFCIAGAYLLIRKPKKKRNEEWQQKQQNNAEKIIQQGVTVTLKHTTGLSLAEGAGCQIDYGPMGLTVKGGGTTYKLTMEKITAMEILTDVDIQKQYVSSVGGAVGGAILLGGLGAVIGGRAKQKKNVTETRYFVVNYLSDDEVKSISFEVTAQERPKVEKVIRSFSLGVSEKASAEIEL